MFDVALFQIVIMITLLIAAFFGLGVYLLVFMGIVMFSLVNIYTIQLLVIQFTTIITVGSIGLIVATVVSLIRKSKSIAYWFRVFITNHEYRKQLLIQTWCYGFKVLLYSFYMIFIGVTSIVIYNDYGNGGISYIAGLVVIFSFIYYVIFLFRLNNDYGGMGCFLIMMILAGCLLCIHFISEYVIEKIMNMRFSVIMISSAYQEIDVAQHLIRIIAFSKNMAQ
ncbi:hypothetical protein [Halalkalibacter hemicellulosilyticus]|uniref:Uncharacterized protein n=1 Tax=Halalkalibacter hemicellulosilyticusJCM 9152 TaxID=1236971 RepID=W4QBH0_9BACI|nr:hypothetical protein [Halalkalibacter hemicellulosilyticus]GAE29360.1 hypothetical protein JCM9152_713 [Halalkalibacter hemicellulosilyticusJCM 9152]